MKDIFGHGGSRLFSIAMGKGTNYSVQGVTVANGLYPSAMLMAPLWTPAEIPGAVVFDAAASSSITLDGSAVTEWRDMLGSGIVAVQATPASQPAIGTDEVVFAGDYLAITGSKSAAWVKAFHSTGGHILAITRTGNSSNPDTILAITGTIAASSSEVGFCLLYDDRSSQGRNNAAFTMIANGSSGNAPANPVYGNAIQPNTVNILSFNLDPSNGVVEDRLTLRVNEGSLLATNTAGYTKSTANSTYDLQIGAVGSAIPLVGSISVIAYLPPISEADRLRTVGWAAHRYGRTALLPESHPYKNIPPIL